MEASHAQVRAEAEGVDRRAHHHRQHDTKGTPWTDPTDMRGAVVVRIAVDVALECARTVAAHIENWW
jgi:hypothetical protein